MDLGPQAIRGLWGDNESYLFVEDIVELPICPVCKEGFLLPISEERTSIFSLRENAIAQEPALSYPQSWRCASRLGASIGGAGSCEPSP